MKPGGERDHFVGDVDPDDRRSTFGGPRGDIAGTRCYVEESETTAGSDRIQQRLDKPGGDLTEEAVVPGRLGVPTRQFERRKRV
jgi:hypothetical protein